MIKMKRIIAAFMVLMLIGAMGLTACSDSGSAGNSGSEEKAGKEDAEFGPNTWLNTDVDGAVTEETSAEPADHFALAKNKDELLATKIPEGRTNAGGFYDIMPRNDELKLKLITDKSMEDHDASLVRKYYSMLMDWDKRNEQGVAPLKKYVDDIQSISTLDEMTAFMKELDRSAISGLLFVYDIWPDRDDPSIYTVEIDPPKLTLEDSTEYGDGQTEAGRLLRENAEKSWPVTLAKLGYSDDETEKLIKDSFELESILAEHIIDIASHYTENYEKKSYNPCDMDGLEKMAGSFPIRDIMDGRGFGGSKIYNVTEPDYIGSLSDIYTEDNLEKIKAWLITRAVSHSWTLLDKDTRDKTTEISNEINGIEGVESDKVRALNSISDSLVVPLDNMYIRKYCTEEMRDDITEIINRIIDSYREILDEEDWLSEETREKALEKLDNLTVRAAYPDKLGDWSDLELKDFDEGGSVLEADLDALKFKDLLLRRKINTKVDKTVWNQTVVPASTVNAYYDPYENSINILAGILSSPMYDKNASYEENLGAIGVVIGHEISHAFDTSGSQYDKDGRLSDWWTDEDRAAFNERAQKLIDYYNRIEPLPGTKCNGEHLQGEAAADMGGVKATLRTASKEKDFDYDKYFSSFASMWAVKRIKSEETRRITQDEHPLPYLRVNIPVQQCDEFVETYAVKEGDGMYLAPEDRINIW